MKQEIFDQMMENLSKMLTNCEEIARFASKGEKQMLESPINEYNKMVKMSRTIQSDMDRLFKVELYHVIGMGHMNGNQTLKFTKAIQQLGEYRTMIKVVAGAGEAKVLSPEFNPSEFESTFLLPGTKLVGSIPEILTVTKEDK